MIEGRANELPDFQIFKTVIKYCLIIIVLPIVAFFVTKSIIFDGILGVQSITSNVYSAVVSVIVLHVTLGLYIYRAYNEAEKTPKPIKLD